MKAKFVKESLNRLNDEELNEISVDTFRNALNASDERGYIKRTEKLGTLFFNKFIGLPLLGGKISDIKTNVGANYKQTVTVEVDFFDKNVALDSAVNTQPKQYLIYYISDDSWNIEDEIDRKDAVILSKIALHINPKSKYKETGRYFNIKGY